MSACQLRGRKRLQSNADEAATKRTKTNTNEDEGNIEGKKAMKGKGKMGEKIRCVANTYGGLITNLQPFGRMTAAQRAARDSAEEAKGAPVSVTRYVFLPFFFLPFVTLFVFIYMRQSAFVLRTGALADRISI